MCGTGFGNPTDPPNGLNSYNDTSGTTNDTAGAADFTCAVKTTVNEVWVRGYGGAEQEQFNVAFYKNDPADGSDEPKDRRAKCAYTGLLGTAGGAFPTDVLTQLILPRPCKFRAGKTYWVAVQNNDAAPNSQWYWMVQDATGGSSNGDWADRHNAFGTGCTRFDNDRYESDCFPQYPFADFMLELH